MPSRGRKVAAAQSRIRAKGARRENRATHAPKPAAPRAASTATNAAGTGKAPRPPAQPNRRTVLTMREVQSHTKPELIRIGACATLCVTLLGIAVVTMG